MGRVVGLFISPGIGQRMQARPVIRALAGQGLAGDRYAIGQGSYCRVEGPLRVIFFRYYRLVTTAGIRSHCAKSGALYKSGPLYMSMAAYCRIASGAGGCTDDGNSGPKGDMLAKARTRLQPEPVL